MKKGKQPAILFIWTNFFQNGYIQSKTEKNEHYIMHMRISQGTKFQVYEIILIFGYFQVFPV